MNHKTCDAVEIGTPNEIVFCPDPEKWIMKLTAGEGILFNREDYPESTPDDFAQAVIEILEQHFSVTFERKIPPYNKKPLNFS